MLRLTTDRLRFVGSEGFGGSGSGVALYSSLHEAAVFMQCWSSQLPRLLVSAKTSYRRLAGSPAGTIAGAQ